MVRIGGRAATILGALCAALLLAAPPAAETKPTIGERPEGSYSASFSPRALSTTERVPVTVRTAVRFWEEDGSQVPALKELRLRFDRALRLGLKEVPACSLAGRGRPEPERTCRDALVAQGRMKVDTRFPDRAPVVITAKATLYKTAVNKEGPRLLLYSKLTAPVASEIVTPVEVERGGGRYGLEMIADPPKIAGGAGSITHLGLRFRHGMFDATCPRSGSLFAGFTARFVEGTGLSGAASRFCR